MYKPDYEVQSTHRGICGWCDFTTKDYHAVTAALKGIEQHLEEVHPEANDE